MATLFEIRLRKFKPEFGNEHHINIVEKIGKLNKLKQELAKKEAEAKGSKKVREDIKDLQKRIYGLIGMEDVKG